VKQVGESEALPHFNSKETNSQVLRNGIPDYAPVFDSKSYAEWIEQTQDKRGTNAKISRRQMAVGSNR